MKQGEHKYEVPVPDEIKRVLQGIGAGIGDELPEGWGFALFLVEHGDNGILTYISSVERPGMVDAIEDWVRRQREG